MILSLVKYFKGGVSYDYLANAPIPEVLKKHEHAVKLNQIEKREMGK